MNSIRTAFLLISTFVVASGCISTRPPKSEAPKENQSSKGLDVRPSKKHVSCEGFQVEDLSESHEDYDYSDYSDEMLATVRENWVIPNQAKAGAKGVVGVRFSIRVDGSVGCMDFVTRSGLPPLDFAAWHAIADADPFLPLPVEIASDQGEMVTIHFYYNMKPPPKGTVTFEGRVLRAK